MDLSVEQYRFILFFLVVLIILIIRYYSRKALFEKRRKERRDYYRNDYLKSDAWRRKRYVVMKRDNWQCVHCGKRATQVHHKRYAKYNIGKEPVKWLESVCQSCHYSLHN